MTYDRDALHALIRERALKFGEFTLASGQTSSYYLDGKQVALHAAGSDRSPRGSWNWPATGGSTPSAG